MEVKAKKRPSYQPCPQMEIAREFYDKLVKNRLIVIEEVVTGDQIRKLLDPFPIDVVTSDMFVLCEIPINDVEPTGNRWVPCSRSVGPIVVDSSKPLRNNPKYYDLPMAIVIEGKHRLLDARERGEKKIQAWVGDTILEFFK